MYLVTFETRWSIPFRYPNVCPCKIKYNKSVLKSICMICNLYMYWLTLKYIDTYAVNIRDAYGSTSDPMYDHTLIYLWHMYWSTLKSMSSLCPHYMCGPSSRPMCDQNPRSIDEHTLRLMYGQTLRYIWIKCVLLVYLKLVCYN